MNILILFQIEFGLREHKPVGIFGLRVTRGQLCHCVCKIKSFDEFREKIFNFLYFEINIGEKK